MRGWWNHSGQLCWVTEAGNEHSPSNHSRFASNRSTCRDAQVLAKAHALGFTIAHPTCKESFCQKTRMKLRNNVGWRTRNTNSKQWGLVCVTYRIRPDLVDRICNPPAQEAETGLMQHRGQLVYRVRLCLI